MKSLENSGAHSGRLYWFIALVAAFAGVLFGYDTGVISGAILFISHEFQLNAEMNGIIVGMVLVGAFLGALVSGHLSDVVGRKRLLVADTIIFIIGTLLTGFAHTIPGLVMGRLIVGVAIGISSYSAPLYIAEIAPPKHRGALVSLNQLSIALGLLLSYGVDYHFSFAQDWRAMFLIGVIPAVGLLIAMCILPYSPRWMILHGHDDRARSILRLVRGNDVVAEQEFHEIKHSLNYQRARWQSLFQPRVVPVLIIGIALALIQQVTGINTILYYAPTIFSMAGFADAQNSILVTGLIGIVFVAFSALAIPMIDRFGRRFLLLLGVSIMTLSLILLGYLFLPSVKMSHHMQQLSVFIILVYIAAFAVSLGPVMWLMIAELFPIHVRGLGASVCTAVNWGSNWLVAVTFLSFVHFAGQGGTFLTYGLISLLSLLFIYLWVPETKGVTLEQIEAHLFEGRKIRDIGKEVG
ncbi:MAG: sugar porter family MFS transporter [Coxiellaceae bacterium]|nr:sugar porter family MFS transporter [Coxiellaceae bacterium]